MKLRFCFTALVYLAALLLQAPASLWDSLLQAQSQGKAALLSAQGSMWAGSGTLAVRDAASGRYLPLMPISWRWQASRLLRAEVAWDMSLAASQPFRLALTPARFSIHQVQLDLPAPIVLGLIPNAIGNAGWHGDMRLSVPQWQCNWQQHCEGEANLLWRGAAADIFPRRHLGDYVLSASGQGDRFTLDWRTDRGEARVNARGEFKLDGSLAIRGNIAGDPAFTSRLPNIAGRWVRPTAVPGSFDFDYQQAAPQR